MKRIGSLYNEAIKFRNSEFNKLNPNYESIFNQFEAIRKEAATNLDERRLIAASLFQMGFIKQTKSEENFFIAKDALENHTWSGGPCIGKCRGN